MIEQDHSSLVIVAILVASNTQDQIMTRYLITNIHGSKPSLSIPSIHSFIGGIYLAMHNRQAMYTH